MIGKPAQRVYGQVLTRDGSDGNRRLGRRPARVVAAVAFLLAAGPVHAPNARRVAFLIFLRRSRVRLPKAPAP